MKLTTPVQPLPSFTGISLRDTITVLGSCFADNMGERMEAAGFNVCVNPFGTLYNPASIAASISRLDSGRPFTEEECVEMGAGAGLVCSFSHHTSFARKDREEFLRNANSSLEAASEHWKRSGVVIITLGTAQVWRHLESGMTVSNCLKRPGYEFSHEMLSLPEVESLLSGTVASHIGKRFIFTVSPIRHLGEGAHTNTLSKSTLLLAVEACLGQGAEYFPSYEIMMDELRDYRFYAEDLVHPSPLAEEIIWEKFISAAVPEEELETLRENERRHRREGHRPRGL